MTPRQRLVARLSERLGAPVTLHHVEPRDAVEVAAMVAVVVSAPGVLARATRFKWDAVAKAWTQQ